METTRWKSQSTKWLRTDEIPIQTETTKEVTVGRALGGAFVWMELPGEFWPHSARVGALASNTKPGEDFLRTSESVV